MKLNLRLNLFAKELVLFVFTLIVGVAIAYRYRLTQEAAALQGLSFSWWDILQVAVFFLVFSFVTSRFQRAAGLILRLFLALLMLSGIQLVLGFFIPSPYDLGLAVIVLAGLFLAHNVLAHNLGIGLGIASISALLGLSLTPLAAVGLLVALSIYDIIAVYGTHHMVKLANNMIASGAIFGFLIPARWQDFFKRREHAIPGQNFMILGSGDIGLPIVMTTTLTNVSFPAVVVVALASVVGLFVTHLMFVNQKKRQAMAALPPIATCAILGYLLTVLF